MFFQLVCPACQKHLTLRERSRGKKIHCTDCGEQIHVPAVAAHKRESPAAPPQRPPLPPPPPSDDIAAAAVIPPPLPVSATLRKKRTPPAVWFAVVMLIVAGVTAAAIAFDHIRANRGRQTNIAFASNGGRRFDPNNLDAAGIWAQTLTTEVRTREDARSGNALAMQQIHDERRAINQRLALLNGSEVRWNISVNRVTDEQVVLNDDNRSLHFSFGKKFRDFSRIMGSTYTATLDIGKNIDVESARSLRPGDDVSVTGRVQEIVLEDGTVFVELIDVAAK